MRAMRADGKLELEQQLVRLCLLGVIDAAVLAAHLTELARPVAHRECAAAVVYRRLVRVFRSVVSRAREPPPRELVVERSEIAERPLRPERLLASAPDQFGAADERVVDRSLQRPPA